VRDRSRSRVVAAGLLGAVLGASVVAPFAGRQAETLRLTLHERSLALEEANSALGHLQAELRALERRRRAVPTVRTALVTVTGVDPVTALTLAEAAEHLVLPLLGRPLDSVDADLVRSLLDRRLLQADDRLYRVRVRYAVLATVTKIELVATAVEP
jgi:hypothetical protein